MVSMRPSKFRTGSTLLLILGGIRTAAAGCRDKRKPGRCEQKKAAGECAIVWGCDLTCGRCGGNASQPTIAIPSVRQYSQSTTTTSARPSLCKDQRRPGKCELKKAAGECPVWGCDLTCGICGAHEYGVSFAANPLCVDIRRNKARCAQILQEGQCPDSGCKKTCGECKAFMRLSRCRDGFTQSNCSAMREQGLCQSPASGGCNMTCGHCVCADDLPKERCQDIKQAGECDQGGCDMTCGICHVPIGWDRKQGWFPKDWYKTLVRKGSWWESYSFAQGGFATVIVPTICKRMSRLKALALRLVTEMRCVGEVLVVAQGACVKKLKEMAQQMRDEGNITTSSCGKPEGCQLKNEWLAPMAIVDLGDWDSLYGPGARFLAAQNARKPVIVHLDDDELPCERQVCTLAAHALTKPVGIYGHHRRICDENGYRYRPSISNFTVLLTLFAATSRIFNDAFVSHFDNYAALLADTRGNGEDIAYSHFLMHHYNETPTFVSQRNQGKCYSWSVNESLVESYRKGFSKFNEAPGISNVGRGHYVLRKLICRRYWRQRVWSRLGTWGRRKDHLTNDEVTELKNRSMRRFIPKLTPKDDMILGGIEVYRTIK